MNEFGPLGLSAKWYVNVCAYKQTIHLEFIVFTKLECENVNKTREHFQSHIYFGITHY